MSQVIQSALKLVVNTPLPDSGDHYLSTSLFSGE